MIKKIQILIILNLFSFFYIYSDSELLLGYRYNNLLNYKYDLFDVNLNSNLLYIDLNNNFNGFDFNFGMDLKKDNLDDYIYSTRFLVGKGNNYIDLNISEDPSIGLSGELPLSNYIDLGASISNKKVLDLSNDFSEYGIMDLDTRLNNLSAFIRLNYKDYSLKAFIQNKVIYNSYDSSNKNIQLNYNLKDDNSIKLFFMHKGDASIIKLEGEYTNYDIGDDYIKVFKNNNLFGGFFTDDDIELISVNGEFSTKKYSLNLNYLTLNIKNIDATLNSKPYTGIAAFRVFQIGIPKTNIYKIEINNCWTLGGLEINLEYLRLFIDNKSLEYLYKDMIWTGFSASSIMISDPENLGLEYNHINIIKPVISYNLKLTNDLSINISGSQLIPFFDDTVSGLFKNSDNNISDSINTTNENEITGGTNFNIYIKYSL